MLTALPAAIGELGALTELDLRQCGSLTELPETIGKTHEADEVPIYLARPSRCYDAIGKLGALKPTSP